MKVVDKFTDENLFEEIVKLHPFMMYNFLSAETLNALYLNKHGERTLSKTGVNMSVPDIAKVIVSMYGDKWDLICSDTMRDFPVLENYVETVTEKTNENGNSTNDTTETNTGKVSAYNDDDFVNDEQNTNTNTMKSTNENIIAKTVEKKVVENATKNLENAINYLQNNVIYIIMYKDINDVITLNIFD